MRIASNLALAGVVLLVTSAATAQPTLTGMVQFSTDSAGSAVGGQVWNTLAGGAWNLYVIQGPAGGPFVNTGDGPTTSIAIPLPIGTHSFTLNSDYSNVAVPYMGLNLFFAGDNTNPRISVFGADGVLGGAATGGNTFTLAASPIPGANTLSFTTDNYRVTLSDFLYSANVASSDRVQPFDSSPNGRNDNLVTFTLTVEALPAVPTLTTAGIAVLGLLIGAAALVALRRLG
ncbi:MAG: hypothetical protein LAO05_18085 [Acidobacteriia bacterium]|nr:hypothetical protein [Terriglobia bacterium]